MVVMPPRSRTLSTPRHCRQRFAVDSGVFRPRPFRRREGTAQWNIVSLSASSIYILDPDHDICKATPSKPSLPFSSHQPTAARVMSIFFYGDCPVKISHCPRFKHASEFIHTNILFWDLVLKPPATDQSRDPVRMDHRQPCHSNSSHFPQARSSAPRRTEQSPVRRPLCCA